MVTRLPVVEHVRLEALKRLDVLDTPPEAAFERIVAMASRIFEVPIVSISLIDSHRQWSKATINLDCSIPRSVSFCAHAIEQNNVLVVPDTWLDERFRSNPLVTGGPHTRFYAGAPLVDADGVAVGALCILDTLPRELSANQCRTLQDLAAMVMDEFQLRQAVRQIAEEERARHLAEQQLLESQTLFKSAFKLSTVGMAIVSPEGHWLQVNEELCRMLGYHERDLICGRTFLDITHPDDVERNIELKNRLIEGLVPMHEMEKRFICGDGSVLWVKVSVVAVRDAQGVPLCLVAQIQDISAHRRSESHLRQSEALKAGILETALDGIITINSQGLVEEWNPAAEKIFGFTRDEAVGRPMHDLIVPQELRAAHCAGLARYMLTGEGPALGRRLELPAVCKDGRTIAVELAIVPIPGSVPPVFTGHVRDITERQKTLQALRESEERYHCIATNVPGMVYQFFMDANEQTSFAFVSEGCRELYGLEPEQLIADPSLNRRYVHPDDLMELEKSVRESARTLQPWHWQGRITLPSGQNKWIRGSSRPRREENGLVVWDGILYDISEMVRALEEQRAAKNEAELARAEAERANIAKSEFLSRMSHELRTPLNAIIGFGQLLETDDLPEKANQRVEYILKGGYHLLGLINEVLDIARIETGNLTLEPESICISEVIEEVIELVRPLARERSIEISSTLCHGSCQVFADMQRLKQVLLNLLSNAVKYNREGGEVFVSCPTQPQGANAKRLSIEVRDTGLGIAPEDLERVWIPFDRLGADAQNIQGTGIGLPLSRRLTEAMQGTITIQSVVGQGSAFTLSLPAPLLEKETTSCSSSPTLPTPTCHVALYMEATLSGLRLVKAIWADRPEIRLLSARRGDAGCDLARLHLPDVILLNASLEECSAEAVLERLRDDNATHDIPVVVIGADKDRFQRSYWQRAGATAFLQKPLDIDEFRLVVNNLLTPRSNTWLHPEEGKNGSLGDVR